MIKIYCDGAYSPSRLQGGWAFVALKDDVKIHSSFFPVKDTTNNRMEMQAAIEACKWAVEQGYTEITILSDSMYVIGTMTQNWKKKKNVDLWLEMEEVTDKVTVNWLHVKGHSGDRYNELCDVLAVAASQANN